MVMDCLARSQVSMEVGVKNSMRVPLPRTYSRNLRIIAICMHIAHHNYFKLFALTKIQFNKESSKGYFKCDKIVINE